MMRMPSGDKPTMAVVICSDKGLFWQGAFFLQRAVGFDADHNIDFFYYCCDTVPEIIRKALPERVILVDWQGDLTKGSFGLSRHLTQATLLRLYAVQDLAAQYDLVAYFDIDIFLRWGDIANLRNLTFSGQPAAAVRDRSLWGRSAERWVRRNYLPRFSEAVRDKYFNAGFILANGPVWSSEDVSGRALAFLKTHPEVCHYADQSALNAVIDGNWLELSPTWNWQANMRYDFLIPSRNPRLVHFTGPIKPWSDKWKRFDEYYAQMMYDWMRASGLNAYLEELDHTRFTASFERRRTREFSSQRWDPMEMRQEVKPYLDRVDFADAAAGIETFGWFDDRKHSEASSQDQTP